jgi:copper transport protein
LRRILNGGTTTRWSPRTILTRLLQGSVAAAAAVVLLPATASAHALVVRSDPAAGSSLAHLPPALTITFSEVPEANQSSITVVDSSGKTVSRGPARPVPGSPLEMSVPLSPLLNGVYTVRWKTVSRDDGHASTGTFTFGVGPAAYAASAGPAPALAAPPTASSPLIVAGHWVFYVGLGLLVGGAWVTLFALRGVSRRLLTVTLLGALAMLGGLAVYGLAQAVADGTPPGELPSTSLGLGLVAQAVPGLGAAVAVEVALLVRGRARSGALAAATALAAVTILVHVLTTHAASSRAAWLQVTVQWAHLASFATWIGGLAALLIAVGTETSPAKAAAVRRFSQVAAVSLAVVGVTGLLRAIDEVAAWDALVSTLFGQLVLAKVALLITLAALGGWNRLRSVPAVDRSLRGLRRVGRVEVGVAGATLVASALLTSLIPPALVQKAATQPPPPHLVAQSTAASVRAVLDITPGYPGQNRFTLRAYDAGTTRAVAGAVTLAFAMPARPDLQTSSLPLQRLVDGSYGALGDNLSLIGDWVVTAQVQMPGRSVEVPIRLTANPSPEQLHSMTMGGLPMVFGLHLSNDWLLQAYLTPGRPGRNTLHMAFTDTRNGPVQVVGTPVVTARQGQVSRTLQILRLGFGTPTPNQFYGVGTFTTGRWTFQTSVDTGDGRHVTASFTLPVGKE